MGTLNNQKFWLISTPEQFIKPELRFPSKISSVSIKHQQFFYNIVHLNQIIISQHHTYYDSLFLSG